MVHDAHLFILQIHASCFGAGWQGEMVLFFSVRNGIGRFSMGQRSRMSQSSIMIDALSSACWEKEENSLQVFFFSPGWDIPCLLCCAGVLRLLGAIKCWFKGQSLNFMCT
jgi:hypothetical protein